MPDLVPTKGSRPSRAKLQERCWAAATVLTRERGVYGFAEALPLDDMGLKRGLGDGANRRREEQDAFIGLFALFEIVRRCCTPVEAPNSDSRQSADARAGYPCAMEPKSLQDLPYEYSRSLAKYMEATGETQSAAFHVMSERKTETLARWKAAIEAEDAARGIRPLHRFGRDR